MKKLMILISALLLGATAHLAIAQAKAPKAPLYHAYEHEKYVADASDSTEAYVSTQRAEESRPVRIQIFVPGLFIGRFGTTIDFKLTNALALGAIFRTWSDSGNTQQDNKTVKYNDFYNLYGINMEYAVNGNLNMSGWILNPRIQEASYRFHDGFFETDDDKVNKKQNSTEAGIYLMHQWAWPTGIYMQLGFGAVYSSNPNTNVFSLNSSHFGGDWDYSVGYAF